MLDFARNNQMRISFCRDLQRHIERTYEAANQTAESQSATAEHYWQQIRFLRFHEYSQPTSIRHRAALSSHLHETGSPPAKSSILRPRPSANEWTVEEMFLDALHSAADAAEWAECYAEAYHYVHGINAREIDLSHPALSRIASAFGRSWQKKQLKMLRKQALSLGFAVTFTPLHSQNDVSSFGVTHSSDEGEDSETVYEADYKYSADYRADDEFDDDEFDDDENTEEEDNAEITADLGLYEVYSGLGSSGYGAEHTTESEATNSQESDLWLDEAELRKQEKLRHQLNELIERSPDYAIVAPLAKEFLDWAHLMGEAEFQRTCLALWEAISWFHQFGKVDSDTLRQAINDNLEAALDASDSSLPSTSGSTPPSQFPPTFYRHTTGSGQFWRVQRDYHGSWSQNENWNPADEI